MSYHHDRDLHVTGGREVIM